MASSDALIDMETEALWYELRDAVFFKDLNAAEKLIAANPDLLDKRNSIGETVLHYLAVEDDIEGVAWLQAHGFNLNTRNRWGTPMIFEVASLGYVDLLDWLEQNGADFSVVDSESCGIVEHLLDGLDQEISEPSTEERAKTYWQRHRDALEFLIESVPGISMSAEQKQLFSALTSRGAQ